MRSWLFATTSTERKLYAVFQARWRGMSEQDFRKPVVRIQTVLEAWDKHIVSLGMSFSKGAEVDIHVRDSGDKNHYVVDPASPLDEKYIVVPDELALKILALGHMP